MPARLAAAMPRAMLVVGAILAFADAFSFGHAGIDAIERLLPVDALDLDPAAAVVSAIALAALALGLARGKRLAWWIAVATFAVGVPVQVVALGHPVGGVLAVTCLVLLSVDGRRYRVPSAGRSSWRALVLLGLGGVATTLEALLALASTPIRPSLPTDLADVAGLLGSWLSFGELPGAVWYASGPVVVALALLARLAIAMALVAVLSPGSDDAPDPTLRARVGAIAERYGRGALLPFQLADDKRWFCPPGQEAALAFGRDGRAAVVVGEPIGRPEDAWPLFAQFVDVCRRRDWVPIVYQATPDGVERLRALGFRASPIGREAIVDLAGFDLAASRRANLRHTIARARRGGVTVRWLPDGLDPGDAGLLRGCAAVDAAWRATAGRDMGFTITRFGLDVLTRPAIGIALDADGAPIAFATFRPTGADGGWVLDLLRRAPGGVPGALEWCVAEAAARLREAGATALSLGMAPLSGLDPAGAQVDERALAAIARLVRPFYDVAGLAFFKDKFGPRWEARFVAAPGRAHLPLLVLALARLHLGSLRWAALAQLREAAVAMTRRRARPASPGLVRR